VKYSVKLKWKAPLQTEQEVKDYCNLFIGDFKQKFSDKKLKFSGGKKETDKEFVIKIFWEDEFLDDAAARQSVKGYLEKLTEYPVPEVILMNLDKPGDNIFKRQ